MAERIEGLVAAVAMWMEVAGVLVILAGGLIATVFFLTDLRGDGTRKQAYHGYRSNLGRAILLGLELLVAGDIIGTILVEPTVERVAVLGMIVLIRTFLSFSLETEISGVPPWRRALVGESAVRERQA